MPTVDIVLKQLTSRNPTSIPTLSDVKESDLSKIQLALKDQNFSQSNRTILNIILSEARKKTKHKDFLSPMLDINFKQLKDCVFMNDVKLRVCETIIEAEDMNNVGLIQTFLEQLDTENLKDLQLKARMTQVSAGGQILKGDYLQASIKFLAASHEQAHVKNDAKKIELINKSIAYIYLSECNMDSHRVICTLCLNDFTKRSPLWQILYKLHRQDIITNDQIKQMRKVLSDFVDKKDENGVSLFNRAKFTHSMIPIMNCFSSISFETLQRLMEMKIYEILILMEKTYRNGELQIDQISKQVYFRNSYGPNIWIKDFLHKIDDVLV